MTNSTQTYLPGATGYNFDGGNSTVGQPFLPLQDGNSTNVLTPGGTAPFDVVYAIIAPNKTALKRVNLTFADFNDPTNVRFYNTALNVAWQKYTEETLNLVSFFHPIQSFSNYQKQTFNIPARSSINFDIGNFEETYGEVSLLMAQAEYLPHFNDETFKVLYWNYKTSPRYVMGEYKVLTVAEKNN